jgi:hypothetical protein
MRKCNCLYGEISETLKNFEFCSACKFQDDVVEAHTGFINNWIQKNSGAFQGALEKENKLMKNHQNKGLIEQAIDLKIGSFWSNLEEQGDFFDRYPLGKKTKLFENNARVHRRSLLRA